ncbi:MAG TPA: DUF1565 domain-containing protein, partial [Candidatus Marinimicrobia bacterium]|nr:DUF1565 domain-containing protein [Candidatus Neomarinimicrobiota bacterium]
MGAYPYLNSYSGPTWYVNTEGNDTTGTGTSVNPFASIQAGINFSSDDDSVTVAAGTYVENINFRGRNIKVVGEDRETTIINPSDYIKPVVDFYGDAYGEMSASLLSNFTISGSGYSPESNYGALRIVYGPRPRIEECIFVNNYKVLRIDAAAPTFNNNLFYNNDVLIDWGSSSPENYNTKFNKCTFLNNPEFGDSENQINPIFIENSIVDSISTISLTGNYVVTFSNIDGGYIGDGNIDVDPMFVDTANGNYHLLASSQCINAGHPDSLDSDGSRADIGAYYYHNEYSGPTWYITESGNDTTATGASDDPFRSIQSGINFSSGGDSVTVAAGTYVENINFRGRNIRVAGADREKTIIDGNQSGSVVTFENGEDSTAVLKGFTLTNGSNYSGGGLFLQGSNTRPKLIDLIIENNFTSGLGGGIYLWHATPIISNVIIRNNFANQGGGIFGGHLDGSFSNIEISNNTANSYGGIEVNHTTSLTLVNVTISGNLSVYNGSNSFGGSTVNIINSIIWNNENEEILFSSEYDSSHINISYSTIQFGQDSIVTNENGTLTWGDGNIDVDPLFVDADNDDFNLTADSPCIDAGHPDSTDADGTVADMGAYYYHQDGPVRPTDLITAPGSDQITVKWDAVTPQPENYVVYR